MLGIFGRNMWGHWGFQTAEHKKLGPDCVYLRIAVWLWSPHSASSLSLPWEGFNLSLIYF